MNVSGREEKCDGRAADEDGQGQVREKYTLEYGHFSHGMAGYVRIAI